MPLLHIRHAYFAAIRQLAADTPACRRRHAATLQRCCCRRHGDAVAVCYAPPLAASQDAATCQAAVYYGYVSPACMPRHADALAAFRRLMPMPFFFAKWARR